MNNFWKVYFFLFIGIVPLIIVDSITNKSSEPIDKINILISLPSIFALYGWAWKIKFSTKVWWQIYALIFILSDLTYNLFFERQNGSTIEYVIGLVILLPVYIATVLYAVNFSKLKISK